MKGFAEVSKYDALTACKNYEETMRRGANARRDGAVRYHTEVYPHKNWYHRFRYRKLGPMSYAIEMARGGIFIWAELSEVLAIVLTADELRDLKLVENHHHSEDIARQIKALAQVTESSFIYAGDDMAKFINRWVSND